ncbi:MAG: HK97 family phage prohead protease [Rikenellaceae bacterium]|nr:HK97 family phage prohead protease [Rikenellaceae bacterium]
MKQTRFIPTNDCGLQLREPQEGQQESREIEGRPIVFGVRSVNLTPWSSTRKVYEILEPGCISRELLAKSDVILNLNHSNMVPDVLGRFRNSDKDTLSLELRGDGIDCRCDLPKTNNANDALELMKRGDITGMSFAFEDDWEDSENGVSYEKTNDIEDGKEVWLRHVKKITGLYDVAIVTHPAYEQTTVGLREASEAIDKAIEEQLKRECGDKDDKRDDDPDDLDDHDDDKHEETDEEREAREKAEREQREKEEQEARELEEQEQRFREQQAMRLRYQARRLNDEILESLNY